MITADEPGMVAAALAFPYEMFYAGAQFVTAGHSFRTYGARRDTWWTGCWRASASRQRSAARSNDCCAMTRPSGGETMRVAIVNIGT
ncbi:MAG TPA: hypothetical protein VJ454_00845, partial [Steroidobacteraceae bacterium]|nr:hypothetical protein [Steroidobacteraceae bacterium]